MYAGVPMRRDRVRRAGLDDAGGDRAGDAEVRDDRLTVLQQDVLGLDVAMHDALAVGVVQRAGHFLQRCAARSRAGSAPSRDSRWRERLALDVRHDVVEQPVDVARVVQRKDVRMVQPRGDVDLAEKPLAADGGADVGVEDLDRDPPVVLVVLGQVDRGHPAPAQQASHLVRAEACPRAPALSSWRATHETSGAASAAAG